MEGDCSYSQVKWAPHFVLPNRKLCHSRLYKGFNSIELAVSVNCLQT